MDIYVGKVYNKNDPFRVNFYNLDSICMCPGERLNYEEVIIYGVKKKWNKIDISNKYFEVPREGLFISYEYLYDNSSRELFRHELGIVKDLNSKGLIFEKIGDTKWKNHIFMINNDFHLLFRAIIGI